MKKLINLAGLLVCAALIVGVGSGRVYARLTGTTGAAETCWGAAGAEVCVDTSGNFLPTTDDDATLGTSSLRWATAYILDITVGDDLTVTDDLTVAGDLRKTAVTAQVLGAGGTIDLTGACGGLVRVSVTANRTTDTTNTFTAPAAANIGCVYYIVNTGGGTVTLDDNALFDVPANVVLGTNDGAIIVQGDTTHILLGTSDN